MTSTKVSCGCIEHSEAAGSSSQSVNCALPGEIGAEGSFVTGQAIVVDGGQYRIG